MSDEEIMKLFQANDAEAFNEIYERFKAPLYSYFFGLLNSTMAEDLLQETFLKIALKRDTFRYECRLKTWIWTIAKNNLLDYWRTQDHKMLNSFDQLCNDEGEEIILDSNDSQEELYLKKVTKAQLKLCSDELPLGQREILFLHIQSELSNQEIADISQVEIGAIKSIIFRSKVKLSACFKRGGHL